MSGEKRDGTSIQESSRAPCQGKGEGGADKPEPLEAGTSRVSARYQLVIAMPCSHSQRMSAKMTCDWFRSA
jgi:hypothetical protein